MTTSVVPLPAFLKFRFLFSFNAFSAFRSLRDKLCFSQGNLKFDPFNEVF